VSVLTAKYCFFVSHLSKIAVIFRPGRQEDGRRGLVKTLSTEQIEILEQISVSAKYVLWEKMTENE